MSKNMRYLPTGQDFDNRHFPKSRGSASATMQHVNRSLAPKRQMAPQQAPMMAPDDDADDDGTYVSKLRRGGQPKRVKRAEGGPLPARTPVGAQMPDNGATDAADELTSPKSLPGKVATTKPMASPLVRRVKRAVGGPLPGVPGAPPAAAAADGAPVGSDNPMQRATITMPVQDAQKIAKNLIEVGKSQAGGGAPGAPAGPAGALSMGRPGMPGAMPGAGAPPMGGGMPGGAGGALAALGGGGKPMGLRKGGSVKYAKGGRIGRADGGPSYDKRMYQVGRDSKTGDTSLSGVDGSTDSPGPGKGVRVPLPPKARQGWGLRVDRIDLDDSSRGSKPDDSSNYRRGGRAGYAKGGDVAQDKAMVKKGVRQHENQEHGGKHAVLNLRNGGPANNKPRIQRTMKPVTGRSTSPIGIGVKGAPKAKMPTLPKASNSYGGPEGYGVRQTSEPDMPAQGLARGGKARC